jgi:hypothetical protein
LLEVAALIVVLLGILLIFRVSFDYLFAQDDFLFLGRLARVHNVTDLINLFLRNDHFYRPMSRVIMLGIPYGLFGTSVTGYHVFMLGLHLLNVVLVYRLLRDMGARFGSALLGMCVYGAYPVHFMPVVWISAIQELSATFFVLLTVLAFLGWRRKPTQSWRLALTLLAYTAAVLSKEVSILLPVALLAIDVLLLARVNRANISARYFLPYLGLLLVALFFLIIRNLKADVSGQSGPYSFNLTLVSIWTNFKSYALEIYNLHRSNAGDSPLPALFTVALFGVLLVMMKDSRRWLIVGAIWFTCFLLPTLVLSGRSYSYYLSLSSAGVAIALCGVGEYFLNKLGTRPALDRRWIVYGGLCTFALIWMGTSYAKVNAPWPDADALRRKGQSAWQVANDFRQQIPRVAPDSILYVTGAKKGDEAILEGLFNFYAPELGRVAFDTVESSVPLSLSPVYVFHVPVAISE